jgi:small subunit ribosomal protein S4
MVKRNYPPGVHGVKGRSKLTGFGDQLTEKQKAKRIYGILEQQFKKYYTTAIRQSGEAGENLLRLLEMRLDNIIYRLGFVSSRGQAREAVSHGLFMVNNRKVNIPSYQLKVGEIVAIRNKTNPPKLFANLEERITKAQIPSWLLLDANNLTGKILAKPQKAEVPTNFDIKAIIEFYSR